jgi:hypothetical protein
MSFSTISERELGSMVSVGSRRIQYKSILHMSPYLSVRNTVSEIALNETELRPEFCIGLREQLFLVSVQMGHIRITGH